MLTGTVAAQVPDRVGLQEPQRVGGAIKPPTKLKSVAPEYPIDALRVGLEGVVVLDATIDTEGRVGKAEVVSGPGPFRKSAVATLKQWRFTPTVCGGEAVPIIMMVTFDFRIEVGKRTLYLEHLLSALRNDDEEIREAAARALGSVTSSPHNSKTAKRAVSELRKATEDRSERVRRAATEALARIQPSQ
jgi:TonB family protein